MSNLDVVAAEFHASEQGMSQRERLLVGTLLDAAGQVLAALTILKTIEAESGDFAITALAQQAIEVLTKTGNGVIKTHTALVTVERNALLKEAVTESTAVQKGREH